MNVPVGRIIALPLAVLASTIVHGQRATIPESLARAGTSLTGGATMPSGRAPALNELLDEVDVVARGIVGEPRSYLSDDKRDVYTDYQLTSPVILYQREIAALPTPGVIPPLAVTVHGGEVTINGLTFTSIIEALPSIQPGIEGLFLLRRIGKRYFPVGTFFGAFAIRDGKLKPLTKKPHFAREYADVPAKSAQQAILAEISKRRR